MNKKIIIIIIITTLLIIGLLFILNWLQKGKLFSRLTKKGNIVAPVRLNNDQMSTLLLQWANNTRTANGGYAEGERCPDSGACDPLTPDNRIGAVGLWARFKYYLKHQDFDSMSVINKDVLTYKDSKKVSTIQSVFWNCRLLYELWKNPVFSQAQKNSLQAICARSLHLTFDLPYSPNIPIAEALLTQMQDQIAGKEQKEPFFFDQQVDLENSLEYAPNVSEYVGMYQWAQDSQDLKQAQLYFIASVRSLHDTTDPSKLTEMVPLVGLAALDLNKITPNPLFIQYADWLTKQYKNILCSRLQSCVMQAFLYNELYKLDKKDEYRQERDRIISKLYDQQFDYEGLTGFRINKGAFYDTGAKNEYMMVPNMVLAGLLLDI